LKQFVVRAPLVLVLLLLLLLATAAAAAAHCYPLRCCCCQLLLLLLRRLLLCCCCCFHAAAVTAAAAAVAVALLCYWVVLLSFFNCCSCWCLSASVEPDQVVVGLLRDRFSFKVLRRAFGLECVAITWPYQIRLWLMLVSFSLRTLYDYAFRWVSQLAASLSAFTPTLSFPQPVP
jgi:hypothetical protein